MQRIKKDDTVEVIAGKDLGERGDVLRVLPKYSRVVVQGLNLLKKHQKATFILDSEDMDHLRAVKNRSITGPTITPRGRPC